ncbi:hypothetical protein ACSSV1_004884 [Labrenzia sp. MBR-25]
MNAPFTKGAGWPARLARMLRGLAIGTLISAGVIAAGIFILWDTDFYALRDRYEHFRLAMFGTWQPSGSCAKQPEGTVPSELSNGDF